MGNLPDETRLLQTTHRVANFNDFHNFGIPFWKHFERQTAVVICIFVLSMTFEDSNYGIVWWMGRGESSDPDTKNVLFRLLYKIKYFSDCIRHKLPY